MTCESHNVRPSAGELRRIASLARDRILRAAAAQAERDYCESAELTAFEAFGSNDMFAESASDEVHSAHQSVI
jgi:hypothetical protein